MTKHHKTYSILKREFRNNGKTHSHLILEAGIDELETCIPVTWNTYTKHIGPSR